MAGLFSNALEMIKELSTPHAVQYLEPIWSGVDEQIQKLQFSLHLIQPLVEDAEARQLKEQAVRCWLVQLKDTVYDAEDILDEAKTHELLIQRKAQLSGRPRSKVREFFSLDHNPLLFKLQLGEKLRNVNENINDLIEKMDKFKLRPDVENNSNPLGNRPQTYSYLHESRVILGRDEDKEKLVQMLISDCFGEKVAVVSIVGMGGLGKTTLAQLVYADERVKNHFEQCIWVCVSDDFDVPRLAGKITRTAGGGIRDSTNMEMLQQDLRNVLGQKRYLLVLDDVWNEDFQKWDALRNMLLAGGEGSRILVTTRNEKCSRMTGAQKPYILSGLSKENSWVLFEQKAFVDDAEKAPELVEIGKKIVMKCQGLPLAIQVMGSIMRCKSDQSEWQSVLENETWKSQHTENKIMPELWLSYVDLSSHLKRCFAFCAIFPKDHEFKEHELIQFWMAHGLIPSGKGTDMEVEGRETFTELIRRSLLQNCFAPWCECERVCKMHDLIHDVAHFVMANECFTSLKGSTAPEIPIKPRHLSIDAGENYNQGDCSNIHTVLLPYFRGGELSVMSKLKLVRVLDLRRADIKELPASIEHLHHLRYLDLSFTEIRKLPESICMLVNLQTLILYECRYLSKLPKSITYMSSLRHVLFVEFLKYHPRFEALTAGLSQLQNMKTLTVYTVEDDAENNIGQLKSLNPFSELALYNLQKVKNADDARKANLGNKQLIHTLRLSWGKSSWGSDDECCSMENAEEVLEALKPPSGVKKLTVSYYPGKQFPMWMGERQQFQYLHSIILYKCKACEQLPPFEILPCLESLEISRMHGIKHIINNRGNVQQLFPALKFLKLEYMENLEGWCVEEGREANLSLFLRLKRMEIKGCPKLTTLPLGILLGLEELIMVEMDGIKHIVNNRRGNVLQSFPALQKLFLVSMRSLEAWCVEEDREANLSLFPCLTSMEIRRCPKLTIMLPETLPCLQELSMYEMDGIKHIFNNRIGDAPQSFPALKRLLLDKITNLEAWFVEEGREANPSLFPCLISMDIIECPKLTTTMPPIPTLQKLYMRNSFCETQISLKSTRRSFFKHLESLQSLTINSCTEELVLLLEDEEETKAMKSSLTDLWVDSIENLVSWPGEMQGWKSLKNLAICLCKNLTAASSQGDCGPPFLTGLNVFGCDALRKLPLCPKSLQSLYISNCPVMESLWPEMGHLASLSTLEVGNCPKLVSLSHGMQALTSLQDLSITSCPALKSFPEGLQQLLPTLKKLKIKKCPELERLCKPGGDYYNLLSTTSYKQIGEESIQVPREISIGAKQALKCIATNRFLLSAILICAIACFIYFLFNQLDNQNEKESWYIPPT
ncbi:P-loop containing nucleoside triphosphate hydrolase protein [Dioscorea alata]|uniref:P-loop containing nucleoside triphosphate hydrolase protein n=1 Tax=Dioscorea alata TaxID=55571 RepID=A0ACB7VRV9_DIOAL|nr:P-loop containing nucleoside triphosphate hydrolase protein [Dioscorea alata]